MEQEFEEHGRGYWLCPGMDTQRSSSDPGTPDSEFREPSTEDDANLVSSLCDDGLHRPVLDIDLAARLVPSSTEGHFHLYLDGLALSWEVYEKLLVSLRDAGVLQHGYVNAAIERKATFVRPEWVRKPDRE